MIPHRTPFYRLLRRLEAGYHEFLDADAVRDFGPDWAAYQQAGFVRPTGPAVAAQCPDCWTDAHPVTFLSRDVPAISCPACGPVRLSPDVLARSRLDQPALIGAIGEAAMAAGIPTEVSPSIWRLGPIRAGLRSKEAFVAATLDPAHLRAAASVLGRRRRPALFFPTAAGAAAWTGPPGPLIAPLTEYLDFDGRTLQFDHAGFARLLRGDRVAKAPTKPRRKRADRAEKIERLTKAMIDHMTLAHAQAAASMRQHGYVDLSPRPTRRKLARRLRLSESSVSRCLKDQSPAGQGLRKLWQMAINPDDVLRWRGPR